MLQYRIGAKKQITYNPREPLGQSSGIAFMMHEPDSLAFWNYDVRNLKPGTLTEIKMTFEKMEKLPAPYGTCEEGIENTYISYLNKTYKYSWPLCMDTCISQVRIYCSLILK